jgi:hypothetical protein
MRAIALDDVSGRTLEGRVDRLPLGAGPSRRVGVADAGDEAFPAEDRLDIAGPAIGLDPLHRTRSPEICSGRRVMSGIFYLLQFGQ